MNIIIFEDQQASNLEPLTINHASFEIRCGAFTNLERIYRLFPEDSKFYLIVREELADITRERFREAIVNPHEIPSGLYLNGATLWTQENKSLIETGKSYSTNGILIAIDHLEVLRLIEFQDFLKESIQVTLDIPSIHFKYLWDAIFAIKDALFNDSEYFIGNRMGTIHNSVIIDNPDEVFIGTESTISAGVILDASKGPIIIDTNVNIDIGALIQGPVYIGLNSKVNPGAKLRGNVSLGPVCKVGGELEDVIIQGYSNKQHDGFLGHSYVCEWVNLGANTNNSDLKNNYSNVRIYLSEELEINTLKQFLGVLIGDYTKTGISTMFNSGTFVGIGANVFGSDFQAKFISSFSWGKNDRTDYDKFLETCSRVKSRRGLELSQIEKDLLSILYIKSS